MTRHTKENFARYLGTGQIIHRRDMSVPVAHTATGRTRQASVGQAARVQTHQPSAPLDPVAIAEAQRRFEICKTCEHSRDNAFACTLYHGCCFGKFRSNSKNHCPQHRWCPRRCNHLPQASPIRTISTKPTPWCDEPTAADSQKGRGYTVTYKATIVRWNIPDGFEYVAA